MPVKKTTTRKKLTAKRAPSSDASQVSAAIAWLKRHGTERTRAGMARFAIPSENAVGVSVGDIRVLAKQMGRDHDWVEGLWSSGMYEARMLTAFVAEPERLTSAEMDRLCRDFDNWAICDTLCFHLFDRSPLAWRKVVQWSSKRAEFERRAAFALLASLALHDKHAPDAKFLATLPLIEQAAPDGRNFVKKAASWALRGIGERSLVLHRAAVKLASELAASPDAARRWLGKDVLRQLKSPAVQRRLAARPLRSK